MATISRSEAEHLRKKQILTSAATLTVPLGPRPSWRGHSCDSMNGREVHWHCMLVKLTGKLLSGVLGKLSWGRCHNVEPSGNSLMGKVSTRKLTRKFPKCVCREPSVESGDMAISYPALLPTVHCRSRPGEHPAPGRPLSFSTWHYPPQKMLKIVPYDKG